MGFYPKFFPKTPINAFNKEKNRDPILPSATSEDES
jgi:hypothetical protein